MKFVDCSYDEFINRIGDKTVILFGETSSWRYFRNAFPDIDEAVLSKASIVVDNSIKKQKTEVALGDKRFIIQPPSAIKMQTDYIVLITVSLAYHESICNQLLEMELGDDIECFSLPLMTYSLNQADNSCVDKYLLDNKELRIPRIIHSFWFSGDEKPDVYKSCIDSWYKYCPDFKIIEWNMDNYDTKKNKYMKQAIENRKWAFASDFARLDVIREYGGVYLDMDVELVASLNPYLVAKAFFCRQQDGMIELGSGFGAEAGDEIIERMLDVYNDIELILADGRIDMMPQPERVADVLRKAGYVKTHDSGIVSDRLILSEDYIKCYAGKGSTDGAKVGIHWHNGGWLPEKDRQNLKKSREAREHVEKEFFVRV